MKYLRHFDTLQEAGDFLDNFNGDYNVISTLEGDSQPLFIKGSGGLKIYVTTTQRYCSGSEFTPNSTLRDILTYLRNNRYFDGDRGAMYEVYYNDVRIGDWRGQNENWDKSLSELGISSGVLVYEGVLL